MFEPPRVVVEYFYYQLLMLDMLWRLRDRVPRRVRPRQENRCLETDNVH